MKLKSQHTAKTELKRKKDFMESNPNKLTNTIKQKPPLKADIIIQMKTLQEKYDVLEVKYENLLKEKTVEEKILPKLSKEQGIQTKNESEYVEISCTECIFLASCEDELNWHLGETHDKDYISYFETDFPCSVCDRWCKSQKDLNRHMKVFHGKRIKSCSLACSFCDDGKGSKDGVIKQNVESVNVSQSVEIQKGDRRVTCNICDETFYTRRSMMVHKKSEHIEQVAICWNFATGNCEMGDDFCWFSHRGQPKDSEHVECKKRRKMV